jgi:hypothetical protein
VPVAHTIIPATQEAEIRSKGEMPMTDDVQEGEGDKCF